ncbi:MAG: DEAD/DEAH box helicase [Deltaproteobacteria bacterium]|nr:DEAD/DEAH box helicase [Deltaproteobacteria bacterium]
MTSLDVGSNFSDTAYAGVESHIDWGEPAPTEEETRSALFFRARDVVRGPIASELVSLAMRVAVGVDDDVFALREAALEALLHHASEAKRRKLRIVRVSRGRQDVGEWAVHVEDARWSEVRHVVVRGFAPLEASCGCAAFVSSGLGACDHVLGVVLARAQGRKEAWSEGGPRLAPPDVAFDGITRSERVDDPLAALSVRDGARAERPVLRRLAGLVRDRLRSKDIPAARRLTIVRDVLEAAVRAEVTLDPGARAVLSALEASTSRELACVGELEAACATLTTLERKLYPYQREAVRKFLAGGRLLLADDMGLGKSTQASACCHALLASGRVSRVLLVVPASLKPQWRREWSATTPEEIVLVDGTPSERERLYRETSRGVLVIGYEQLRIDLPFLLGFDPELVVLDEAQRIKNVRTQTAAAVRALSPAYRIALTGTPLENRLAELLSVMSFVDAEVLGPPWRATARYTYDDGDGDEGRRGVHRLVELRARLAPVLVRRLRRDVIGHLPARTDVRRPVRLTELQKGEHDILESRIAWLMKRASDRALTIDEEKRLQRWLTEIRIVCNGMAQRDFEERWPEIEHAAPTTQRLASLDAPKLAELREVVRELCVVQGRKIVVFSAWRRMLRLAEWAIRDVLADVGLRAAFFTGAESRRERERAIVQMHDDPKVAALFLTDAGGVGLNLQRAASACVLLEPPWNPAVLEQRISRIHRPGQRQPVDVVHLISEGSFETKLEQTIRNKRELAHEVLDGDADALATSRGLLAALRVPSESETGAVAEVATAPEVSVSLPRVHEDPASLPPAPQPPPLGAQPPAPLPSAEVPAIGLEPRPDGRFNVVVTPEQAAQLALLLAELGRSYATSTMVRT